MTNQKVELGDKVEDIVSGYTGIAVAKTEFINGCIQFSVVRKVKDNEKAIFESDPSFDAQFLKVIKKGVINTKKEEVEEEQESNGGPTTFTKRMRGY